MIGVILFVLGVIGAMAYLLSSIRAVEPMLDKIGEKIKEYNSKPSRIYSADGQLMYEVRPVFSESVSLSTLPKHVTNAILAAEDKRFYSHPGVDWMGLARATFRLGKRGDVSGGGGSTITMQLAKKLFSASEMSLKRKVQDISIAFNLEKRYTKDQILELYINQIYYGEQAYGLNAAAEIYFGKQARDLDLAESAMIARCIRLPSTQNPVKNYQIANTNKIVVLNTMLDEKMITQDEYEKAKEEKPKVRGLSKQKLAHTLMAPYYVAAVKRELEKRGINILEGGYTITTTLDADIQKSAEKSIQRNVIQDSEANVGAFICMDSEGRILADVGGRDFSKNQLSYTTQGGLQPGSSFKSFVYAEALKEGMIGAESEVPNTPIRYPLGNGKYYSPKSHMGYGDSVSLRTAFAVSLNWPALHTFKNLGIDKSCDLIQEDFGFNSKIQHFISSGIGTSAVRPEEMLEAYSVFMLEGKRVQPYRIKEIIDPSGEVVYQGKMEYVNTRIGPDICTTMDDLMRAVVEHGTGRRASECPDAHGKTGTTNEGKCVWFCGYSKGIVGIAWAGKEFKRKGRWYLAAMPESYGGDVAAPLWADAMNAAVGKYGSDVKPDFSKRPESDEMRRKKKPEENPDANNEEPPVEDANNAPATGTAAAPGTNDAEPPVGTGEGSTDVPKKDPASDPGLGDIPATRPETKPKPKDGRTKKTEDEEVEVEVCADTGLLATRYCPETINRRYPKNKRPRRRCNVHKAPDEGGG